MIRGDDLLDVLRRNGYTLHFAGKPHMYRGAADFATFAGPHWHSAGPGVAAARYGEFVSLADLFPTLCELIGAPIPAGVQGRSFAPLLRGEPVPAGEFDSAYAEGGVGGMPYRAADRPPLHFDYAGPTYDELNAVPQSGTSRMVRLGDWKLCYDVLGRAELYDLATDPGELRNRWDDPDAAAHRARLAERLLRWCLRVADDLPESRQYPVSRPPHNWYGT